MPAEKEVPPENKSLIQKESLIWKAEPQARMLAQIHNEADNGEIFTDKRKS